MKLDREKRKDSLEVVVPFISHRLRTTSLILSAMTCLHLCVTQKKMLLVPAAQAYLVLELGWETEKEKHG